MSEKNATNEPNDPIKVEEGVRRAKPARAGKFLIHFDMIEEAADNIETESVLANIFSRCIIYRAEAMYYSKCIEYQAFSNDFDIVEEGGLIPEYMWKVKVRVDTETGKSAERKVWAERSKGVRCQTVRKKNLRFMFLIL